MFTAHDIMARARIRPFVPFRIVMSSGERYDVTHPDLILVGRRDLTVGMPAPDEPTMYDQVARVAIMHITDVQDLPVPVPSGGNGESRRS